ncbi:MAG: Holliday junction resolvase RuvX [Mycoplasmoidaceae bacterium]|nr:Holliday junction resolvase RuvX [Mycoplasmoidaceae bacterium]
MRALGLDLGTKTMGIAITDSNKIIASGLENFKYARNDLNACLNKIKQLFNQYNNDIDVIVIGYPLYPSGDKSPTCLIVDRLRDLIHEHLSVRVILEDERYTTIEATGMLKEIGLKASKIKKIKDKMSAVVILDSWLQHGKV